jgi:hypothetical protein
MAVGLRRGLGIAALAVVCGSVVLTGGAHTPSPPAESSDAVEPKHKRGGDDFALLPAAAQAKVNMTLGAGSPGFVARRAAGGYRLSGGGVGAEVTGRRVALTARDVSISMALKTLGRGDRLELVADASLDSRKNRVSLWREGLTEWYVAGPFGVEQGFTLARRPRGADGPVTLGLRLEGDARARRSKDGAVFLTAPGQRRLSYGALSAVDAKGQPLRAALRLRPDGLEIRVWDDGAAYPLVIDPLIQQAKLIGEDVTGAAGLGFDVALSADGNTAVVGGPSDTDGFRGAVWIFARSGATWTQQGEKVFCVALCGFSVAVSADGSVALAGAPSANGGIGTAVSIRRQQDGVWRTFGGPLTPGGAVGEALFGFSVAISADGSTAVIGGPEDNGGLGALWTYTFLSAQNTWQSSGPKVVANDPDGLPGLGYSLALSGDGRTALAGGPYDNDLVGAAWVFERSGTTWSQPGPKLTGSGGAGPGFFGSGVALSGDGNRALVGAPDDDDFRGAVWSFARSGSTWSQEGVKLVAADESGPGLFGVDVAMSSDGTTALVGGPDDNGGVGAAWLFGRSGPGWVQQGPKLTASGGIGAAAVGSAVSLSSNGTTVLVGGPDDNGGVGAAWVLVAVVAPSAPSGVLATAGDGNATVQFSPPTSDGGAPILYYTVTASPGGQSASGTGGPITVFGLTNGQSYTFSVTATNAVGTGPSSSPSGAVTPFLSERPHPDPPAESPRADVPTFTPPSGPRPPQP